MEAIPWRGGFKALLSQCVPFSLIDVGRVSSAYVVFLFFLSIRPGLPISMQQRTRVAGIWGLPFTTALLHDAAQQEKEVCRQREHSLHQLRKRRHTGSKNRESPSPEDKREASVGLVSSWKHAA
eukprot:1142401-Pelagomonas_calceolata.AAC.2